MNSVEKFYDGSTVLVTGATGFIGSVLVEKLLRCFEVKKIYLMIRAKDGVSVSERLEKFKEVQIFDLLRKQRWAVFEKLVAVEVDYNTHDLSIDQELMEKIVSEVEIVFNIAASVKFNEVLNDAVDINILGTKKIVDLVLGIENLKSFVHVSTLYSNCNRSEVDEKLYETNLNYQQVIQIGKLFKNRKELMEIENLLFQNLPNTYTLTKHFAEKLVSHQAFFMPTGIFRPPIVISNYKDFPGYTDNLNGPSGIVAWTVRGYIHCIFGNRTMRSNLVPVDYCINALITSAWDINEKFNERIQKCWMLPIYNFISSENNLTWGKFMSLVPLGFHEPLQKSIWYYSYFIVSSRPAFKVLNFIYHTFPACLMDVAAMLVGKKMIFSKAYKKIEKILVMMSYFGCREWNFRCDNVQRMIEETKDFKYQRGDLNFDMRTIDWNEYFRNYIPGIKRYFFKESCESIERLKASYQWMKRTHAVVKYLIYFIFVRKLSLFMRNFFKVAARFMGSTN